MWDTINPNIPEDVNKEPFGKSPLLADDTSPSDHPPINVTPMTKDPVRNTLSNPLLDSSLKNSEKTSTIDPKPSTTQKLNQPNDSQKTHDDKPSESHLFFLYFQIKYKIISTVFDENLTNPDRSELNDTNKSGKDS